MDEVLSCFALPHHLIAVLVGLALKVAYLPRDAHFGQRSAVRAPLCSTIVVASASPRAPSGCLESAQPVSRNARDTRTTRCTAVEHARVAHLAALGVRRARVSTSVATEITIAELIAVRARVTAVEIGKALRAAWSIS